MKATIDIGGMYEWDNTIFDEMKLPDGINKTDAINTIILTCRELEINLPDPKYLKFAIGVWSKRNYYYFEEMLKTLNYDYVPIENYDKYEDINVSATKYSNRNVKENSGGKANTKGDTTFKKASYNETDPTERNITEVDHTTTNEFDHSESENVNGMDKTITTSHIHGNIGVMTAMQAIEEQRKVVNISMLDIVATSFKSEFCILIY